VVFSGLDCPFCRIGAVIMGGVLAGTVCYFV
jgi:hypothetical protein